MIISALNEEEFIGRLVDSIKKQSYKNIETIVIDDGSNDRTKEICLSKGVMLLENNPGRRGPAFGWNKAAKQTKAEIICILGADFFLEDKEFVEKSVRAFDEKTVAVYNAFHTMQETWVEKALTSEYGMSMEPRFIRRRDFIEMGMFPEIGFGEDRVFMARLDRYIVKNGLEKKFVKEAFFSGHGVHTLGEMYWQAYWYGKTSLPFLKIILRENGFFAAVKTAFSTYLRMAYFASLSFLLLSGFFPVFFVLGLPFIMILALLLLNSLIESAKEKNPFKFLKPLLFLVFGFGMLHGFMFRLLGIDKKLGR